MTDFGTTQPTSELKQVAARRPHLMSHLKKFKQITGEFPILIEEPSGEYESRRPNVLYPVGGPIFCHIYGDIGQPIKYYAIEPELDDSAQDVYIRIKNRLLKKSIMGSVIDADRDASEWIGELLEEVTIIDTAADGWVGTMKKLRGLGKIQVDPSTYENIRYRLHRDVVGFGPLEPVMRDTSIEDIHVIGPHECFVDHGVYGLIDTTIDFGSDAEFDQWLRNMGERIGDPVSDAHPIIDSTLPDGSRLNVIYSDDVSIKGPSLTIRQGVETPLSVTQITKWGTLSPELCAYLWLCLENEQTVFVVGETASGKTTTLNSIMSFIPRDSKIYTAEDTAEVIPPHDTWQQLLTREGKGEGAQAIDMFDLVAAALRSRPDYIIVGEVRGKEGRMAFQAAQTGHPVMLTFHASDIVSMIQRFTGDPINIPETFMDNADVALFQNRVKQGENVLRRVTSVQEIEGYSKEMGGVVTRQVFNWDPVNDEILFKGMHNSYVLEEQIATLLGYADTRDIYDDLHYRARIVERMIEEDILGYDQVNETIHRFQQDGTEGLPFDMESR